MARAGTLVRWTAHVAAAVRWTAHVAAAVRWTAHVAHVLQNKLKRGQLSKSPLMTKSS